MAKPPSEFMLCPSILSANFARLEEAVRSVEKGGAGAIHLDVMDGHFVPNLTIGPAVVKAVGRITQLPLDVHLMIEEPDRYLEPFREAGAGCISVHLEVTPHLNRTVSRIQELGALAGVVINPATPIAHLDAILDTVDYVLLMSVNPGFGGQEFIPASLAKLSALKERIVRAGLRVRIEVDGGVGEANIGDLVRAGGDWLVAGNAVFGPGDPEQNTRDLIRSMREARR